MKQQLILVLIVAILAGCKKSSNDDGYYTVNGIVIDYDSKTPIAGAKVRVGFFPFVVTDSAISDANGRVAFRFKKEGEFKPLTVTKDNYLTPFGFGGFYASYNDRTDTLRAARPSFVNLTIHKSNSYLPLDSINVQVLGDYTGGFSFNYRNLWRDKADAADKTFNLQALYQANTGGAPAIAYGTTKLYFQWDIIRAGAIVSSKTDSTDLVQFATKNFTINY